GPCNPACAKIIKFMTDHDVPASVGINLPPYSDINGYRYINIFVKFSQTAADEPPLDLGVVFAFDANGAMGARRYVNLEQNVSGDVFLCDECGYFDHADIVGAKNIRSGALVIAREVSVAAASRVSRETSSIYNRGASA